MERVDVGSVGRNKKNLRRISEKVTAQTYGNLERWAMAEHCSIGRVIDKLVRDRAVMMRGKIN